MSTAKKKTKVVPVREHIRKVPISKKNPQGTTVVDRHLRHIDGQYLDQKMIDEVFSSYKKNNLVYPSKNSLLFPNGSKFDILIAVWCDYFNKKFGLNPGLDPNMIKALIATESGFDPNAKNKNALGLTQVTKDTLKIIQNLSGEAKEFVFKDINIINLKNPNTSIAIATRWLIQKEKLARFKLKRAPTSDEIVMEYKGILKDKSEKASRIMKDYRKYYASLIK